MKYTTGNLPLLWTWIFCTLAFIACSDNDTDSALKVNQMVISNVDNQTISLIEGDSWNTSVTTLPESATDAEEYAYRYTSSNEAVFTVNESGVITALGVGEAVLTAWSTNNTDMWATCLVKVEKRIYPVTAIIIPEKFLDYHMGVERIFNLGALITVTPDNATTPAVVYQSSDAMIAEVNEYGEVYTKALGDVIITVKAVDGSNVTAQCNLHIQNIEYNNLLDRSGWTITTSHPYAPDGSTGMPVDMIDSKTTTYLSLIKPGKTVGSISVGANDAVYFVIDLKSQQSFDFFKLAHRTSNTSENIRVKKVSLWGSNDGENFIEIVKDIAIAVDKSISEVTVDLPGSVTYQYVKMTYNAWASGGNTMQISEFNLGNMKFLDNK